MLLDGFCKSSNLLQTVYKYALFGNSSISFVELLERSCKSKTIQFITSRFNAKSEKDQLRHWLLLEMNSKTLSATFLGIFSNKDVLARYPSNSFVKTQGQRLLKELNRLDGINFRISAEVSIVYLEYQNEINKVNQIIAEAMSSFQYISEPERRHTPVKTAYSEKTERVGEQTAQSGQKKDNGCSEAITSNEIRRNVQSRQYKFEEKANDGAINRCSQRFNTQVYEHKQSPQSPKCNDTTKDSSTSFTSKINEEETKEQERKASLETIYGGESSSSETESNQMPLLPLRKIEDVMSSQKKGGEETFISDSSKKKLKNSHVLYKEKFKRGIGMYEYREEPPANRIVKDQDYKCFDCGKPLNRVLLLFNVN